MDIKPLILSATKDYKIKLTDIQLTQLEKYYELLTEWNEKINLTAITAPEEVAVKHFADCLALFNYVDIPENSTMIDVGTGAGFPGVVLKIARPDIKLTLLDSLQKRLNFLDEVLTKLGLEAELVHARAEDGGNDLDYRECFDFSVSRAVARLNILSELCLPYVKLGGYFIAMKGKDANAELSGAYSAINTLGGKFKKSFDFSLPTQGGERSILLIEKERPTPDTYPRAFGKIKAKPL